MNTFTSKPKRLLPPPSRPATRLSAWRSSGQLVPSGRIAIPRLTPLGQGEGIFVPLLVKEGLGGLSSVRNLVWEENNERS